MRTDLQILKLVLRELESEKNTTLTKGLCLFTHDLYWFSIIKYDELIRFGVIIYDKQNKPRTQNNYPYFYVIGQKQIRIDFLKRIIKKYETKKIKKIS